MGLLPAEMDRLMDEHFAFEAHDDINGVVGTLSETVVHDIVGWPGGISTSPDQARHFYESLFEDLADGKVVCRRRLYGENFLVDESEWSGRAAGAPFGIEGRNRPLTFRLLHVVEFSEDRKLKSEQVWVDLATIQAQLPKT